MRDRPQYARGPQVVGAEVCVHTLSLLLVFFLHIWQPVRQLQQEETLGGGFEHHALVGGLQGKLLLLRSFVDGTALELLLAAFLYVAGRGLQILSDEGQALQVADHLDCVRAALVSGLEELPHVAVLLIVDQLDWLGSFFGLVNFPV